MKESSYLHQLIAMLLLGCPKAHSLLFPMLAFAIDLQRQQQGSRLLIFHMLRCERQTISFLFPSNRLYKQLVDKQ